MRNVLLGLVATVAIAAPASAATAPLYVNEGIMQDYPAPQVDAKVFVNYGTFDVQTGLPYDFQNTLFFTNHSEMRGSPGYFFRTASATKAPRPANTFVNDSGARISVSGNVNYLVVSATNLVNRGLLSVGTTGVLELEGRDVDLQRSRLEVRPTAGGGYGDFVTPTNFYPDIGIYDYYWGGLTNTTLDVANLITVRTNPFSASVITPPFVVDGPGAGFDQFAFETATVGVYTNTLSETNQIVQVALVGYDTNILASRIHFSPIGADTAYQVISAELTMPMTNSVDGVVSLETLYISDALAAVTNYVLLTNLNTMTTFRPSNYRVSRAPLIEFEFGDPGNGILTPDLVYSDVYSNQVVDAFWSAYCAYVAGGLATPPDLPGASVMDLPGRVEVKAKTLDLRRARLRGNTSIRVEAEHVGDTEGAYIDAPNLVFNLASTNGTLTIRDITPDVVTRFDGYARIWSAMWTNYMNSLATNVEEDPANPGTMVTNVVTNAVEIGFHTMVLDANYLGMVQEVETYGFTVRSDDVVVEDNLRVVGPLLIDAESATLRGDVIYVAGAGDFAVTNAPRLRFFTNEGLFYIADTATFGPDRSKPYANFVNRGTLDVAAMSVRSDYFENSGAIVSVGPFTLEGKLGKFQGGRLEAGGDVSLAVNDLKLNQCTNQITGSWILNVTNSLADSGPDAGNLVIATDGLYLRRKPKYGDLLGTAVQSTAPRFTWIEHYWASQDRGVSVAGFSNNIALGRLLLSSGQGGYQQFRGIDTKGRYAFYVDYLNLQGYVLDAYNAGNLESMLELDPNVTIYYAYANVPVEELDGALGGQIRWVRDFAGPNSSVDVYLPGSGRTIRVNKGLRESLTIDSDGDGLANGYDPDPFLEPVVTAVVSSTPTARTTLEWVAAPQTTYVVEMTTDLAGGEWTIVATVANPEAVTRALQAEDTLPEGAACRYYRVRYNP